MDRRNKGKSGKDEKGKGEQKRAFCTIFIILRTWLNDAKICSISCHFNLFFATKKTINHYSVIKFMVPSLTKVSKMVPLNWQGLLLLM